MQRKKVSSVFSSEASYRLLVESVSDYAIYMLHPDGTVANWNLGAQCAKGYTPEEIIGQNFAVFYTTIDRACGAPARSLHEALTNGKFEAKGWRVRKDGTQFWAHVVIDPIFDNGVHVGFAKITRDYTEQKKLEENNRVSERRFRLLVEGITDYAIYMLTPEGTVSNWNAGAARAKGYTANEIVGRHFSTFYTDADRIAGLPQKNLATALKDGRFEAEGWRMRKNGTRFWAHVVLDTIYDDDGSFLGFAKITRDLTEHNKSAERISYMARHDGLTGLPNRSQFIERLDSALAVADSEGQRVALIGIDLDKFKDINDAHGHAMGDRVLCVLAERMLRTVVGEGEFVGRFGGDEFVAFKAFDDERTLQDFILKLNRALTRTITLDHTDLIPGASLGVAIYPGDADNRDTLINNADLAMYRAKDSLEEKVCFYEAAMDEQSRARRAMARDIWKGIGNGEFFLHYQIQKDLHSENVTGYEVLLRWNHPTHGLIPPAVFIPIAEECGAIVSLGEWVLETACRAAVEWPLPQRMAVNISPVQLTHAGLVDMVAATLQRTGLDATRLELEVTESAIIGDKARALHTLRQLKSMGITIAIDDFGTGYSSLETLRSFPFDKIKLDRSFINELETSRQAKAFVRAILALGQSLDVSVLAEGVETELQMSLLKNEGCTEVQGFYFGRPNTLEQLALENAIKPKADVADTADVADAARVADAANATDSGDAADAAGSNAG